ncbi:MAG: replicative DNA helicase [Chitinophagales bacterium]
MAENFDTIKKTIGRKPASAIDPNVLEFGKIPPQARDFEEAVLGAVMIEDKAVDDVIDILHEESFYVEAHQKIFRAIRMLYSAEAPIDLLTVCEQLKKNGHLDEVGGAYAIAQLTNKVGSAANVEYHARIISQKYIQRSLISSSSQTIKDAYEDTTDVFELLDRAESDLMKISENNAKKSTEDIGSIIKKELEEIDIRINSEENLNGVPSGFTDLDRATGGWQKSDLIIVAARPGMGKTAFTLALARNSSVDHKKPVAIFSLEMSSNQLVQRLISMESEIPAEKIRRGNLEKHEFHQLTTKIDSLRAAQLFIDDTPGINIFELRSKCRKLKQKHDIGMIIIDYLQLMSGTNEGKAGGNREQEISQISRSLKGLAKELNVPVIALSQLSRAPETRGGNKKPILSDLRESGAIEQDADIVIFLYRAEYYGILQDEEGRDTKGLAEIIIAKHRNGPLKTVTAKFIDRFAKFADFEEFTRDDSYMEVQSGDEKRIFKRLPSRMNEDDVVQKKHGKDDFAGPGQDDDDDMPPF